MERGLLLSSLRLCLAKRDEPQHLASAGAQEFPLPLALVTLLRLIPLGAEHSRAPPDFGFTPIS